MLPSGDTIFQLLPHILSKIPGRPPIPEFIPGVTATGSCLTASPYSKTGMPGPGIQSGGTRRHEPYRSWQKPDNDADRKGRNSGTMTGQEMI